MYLDVSIELLEGGERVVGIYSSMLDGDFPSRLSEVKCCVPWCKQ